MKIKNIDKRNSPLTVADCVRAMRLPFVSASLLPFVYGSLLAGSPFRFWPFLLGSVSVVFTHIGANLINDYADSKSGVDWRDIKFYGFFGGSKLIQEGKIPAANYLLMGMFCFAVGFLAMTVMTWASRSLFVLVSYVGIVFLGFSYSHKPLQLAYRYLSETVIFLLFGCAPVMGAVYLQTGQFPTLAGIAGSLPFGFFTAAILSANQLPDFDEDKAFGKRNILHLLGKDKACFVYALLTAGGLAGIIFNVGLSIVRPTALLSLLAAIPAYKAFKVLSRDYADKSKLIISSRLAIGAQALMGLIMILGVL